MMNNKVILLILATLVSCYNREEDKIKDTEKPISFHVTSTKTEGLTNTVIGNNFPENDQMGVYAFYQSEESDDYQLFMQNTSFTFKNNRPVYTNPLDVCYWPPQGSIAFWGIYPWCNQDESSKIYSITLEDNKLSNLSYTTPTDINQSKDLMIAHTLPLKGSDGSVKLNFSHLLSKIGFAIKRGTKSENTETVSLISLKKIEINGVTQSGNYKYNAQTESYEWELETQKQSYTLFEGNLPIGSDSVKILSDSNAALFIPQDLKKISLNITYSINSSNFQRIISDITSEKNQIWKQGKSYLYNLTIFPTDAQILIKCMEANWDEVPSIGIEIGNRTVSEISNGNTANDIITTLNKVLTQYDPTHYYTKYLAYLKGPLVSELVIDNITGLEQLNVNDILILDYCTKVSSVGSNTFKIVNTNETDEIVKYPIGTSSNQWSVKYMTSNGTLSTTGLSEKGYVTISRND